LPYNRISFISGILPIIFYLLFFKRNREGGYWVIFVYCILSFFADSAFHIPSIKQYSFYVLSILTILEYSLFSFFIYLSFKEKIFKTILIICSLLFYVIALINILSKRSASFDSLAASLEASLLILFSIFFLYEQIKDPTIFYVYNSKRFWIIIAFLLYFSSILFLFIYAVTFTTQQHKSYWRINNIFDTIKNLLFAVAFAMKKNKQPEPSLENFYTEEN
jgi:hypothetical protein